MKKLTVLLAALGLSFGSATMAAATKDDAAVAERIKPVGSVCIEGLPCAAATAASAAAAPAPGAAPRTGEQVFQQVCSGCHGAGVMGAPKFGNKGDWAPRIAQGMATLEKHALGGFTGSKGTMPAKGGCAACSDDEIKNAIKYMTDKSK